MSSIATNLLNTFDQKMNTMTQESVMNNVAYDTHISVPVEADEEVVLPSSPLEEMTIASLDAVLNNLRACGDFSDDLSVPKRNGSYRPTKADKIAAITKIKAANSGASQFAERGITYKALSLADVCLNPDNYRSSLDYIDRDLYESVKMTGKDGIKDIVLSERTILCEDGVWRHPAIAGNRTLSQHFQICDNTGESYNDYILNFKIVEYDQSEGLHELQELRDLVKDNQGSLKPGKLDLARTAQKFMQTMTVKNAAKEVGLHPSELSKLNRILTLPQEILHYVDIQEKADHYAKALSKKQLENFNVPFHTENKDGQEVFKVYGISIASAQILANHLFEINQTKDATKISAFMDFLCSQEVVEASQNLSTKDLTKWLLSQETMRLVGLSNVTQHDPMQAAEVIESVTTAAAKPPVDKLEKKSTSKNAAEIAQEKFDVAKRTFRKDCGMEYDQFINDMMDLKFRPIEQLDAEIANMAFKQKDDPEFLELCLLLNKFCLLIPT